MHPNRLLSSVATCAEDCDIPGHLKNQVTTLLVKRKPEHQNLTLDDDEDEGLDEEGAGADVIFGEEEEEEDEPLAKWLKLARMSSDDNLVQSASLLDFDTGRMSR